MSFAILLSICNLLFKWKGDVVQYSITLQKTKQRADVGSRHEWLGRSSLEQEHHKRGLRRNWISPLGVEVIPCLSAEQRGQQPLDLGCADCWNNFLSVHLVPMLLLWIFVILFKSAITMLQCISYQYCSSNKSVYSLFSFFKFKGE